MTVRDQSIWPYRASQSSKTKWISCQMPSLASRATFASSSFPNHSSSPEATSAKEARWAQLEQNALEASPI
jgi:hypothetical protein